MTYYSLSATQPSTAFREMLSPFFRIFMSAAFLAVCAQVRIPLFFTPVPLTFQTLGILLIASKLGSRESSLSVIVYLAGILFGLPLLSGGRVDSNAFMTPVAGYLVGFVVQAYIAGWFADKQQQLSKSTLFLGLLFSCTAQLLCGAIGLSFFMSIKNAFLLGILPFIAGELLKIMAATSFIKKTA